MHGVEILAQRGLHGNDGLRQRVRANQTLAQSVNAIGQRIVGARHIDEFLQLALERLVALAQHLDLPLHQAHRRAHVAQMRQTQLGQQRSIALEEIRVGLQIFRDTGVIETLVLDPARLTGHGSSPLHHVISIDPANTVVVGPLSHRRSPTPGQDTEAAPPGRSTRTSASNNPRRRPTATAAPAPVPQAKVSPTPRSNTRNFTWPRSTICMNPTLTRLGKRGWFSILGPNRANGAVFTSDTCSTACGLPIETAPISMSAPSARNEYVGASAAAPPPSAASIGSARGSKSGTPMSTDTRPSSPMRACTIPPELSIAKLRPNCGARSYKREAIQRAPLPHCSASVPSELKTR